MLDGAQILVQLGRHGFFLVELGFVGQFFAFLLGGRDAFVGCLNGEVHVGLGFFLGEIDVFRCRVGVQQRLITSSLLASGIFLLLAPFVFQDLLSFLFGSQRRADVLDDVAAAVQNPVGASAALLGQRIPTNATAADGILAAIEFTRRLGRRDQEQCEKWKGGRLTHRRRTAPGSG